MGISFELVGTIVEFGSPRSMRLVVVLAAIVLSPAIASAQFPIVTGAPNLDDQTFARQVIPAASSPASTVAASKVIYLNRGGITLQPGDNDARANKSTLVKQPTLIPAWATSDTTWAATVACMKELFAPFDVTIVTVDPGPTVQHIEAVFGGSPSLLGMDNTVMGVAPFKSDCTILENAIVFTFTSNIPQDARMACEIQAQEIAHAYGLDHERLPSDPMTYMRYDGDRSFQNQLAECGEDKARACGIAGSPSCRGKQNSVALLFDRLGAKAMPGDNTPPTVAITSPANGATVAPGFEVKVSASDNTRVTMASIYIDGVPSGSASVAPWTIKAPANMATGRRTIRVEVTDGRNTRSTEIRVDVRGTAAEDDDLSGGCSTTGGGSLVLALLALLRLRRREPKPDAAHRLDHVGPRQLAAQAQDHVVDGALRDLELALAPRRVEELAARERSATRLHQLAQHGELDRRERDRLAVDPQRAAVEVERQLAVAHAAVRGALPEHAAMDRAHAARQLARADRRDHGVVEAGGEERLAVARRAVLDQREQTGTQVARGRPLHDPVREHARDRRVEVEDVDGDRRWLVQDVDGEHVDVHRAAPQFGDDAPSCRGRHERDDRDANRFDR